MHVSRWKAASDIVFLHEIEAGPASRSYGVQVARLAGMPASLVRQARAHAGGAGGACSTPAMRRSTCSRAPPAAAPAQPAGAVDAALAAIDPDSLTPREALDALYRLKTLQKEQPLMTYCVGIRLDAGLVFLSDSRTNAGLDQISTYRKMMIYERPDDRFMVLLSAGNLSDRRSRCARSCRWRRSTAACTSEPLTIWNATSMFDATRVLGSAVRRVYEQDGPSLKAAGIDFNASDDLRRPDQGRGDAPVPGLFGRQLHRGHARDLLLPGRRKQVRQADPRPRADARPRRWTRPPSARWCRWTRR